MDIVSGGGVKLSVPGAAPYMVSRSSRLRITATLRSTTASKSTLPGARPTTKRNGFGVGGWVRFQSRRRLTLWSNGCKDRNPVRWSVLVDSSESAPWFFKALEVMSANTALAGLDGSVNGRLAQYCSRYAKP